MKAKGSYTVEATFIMCVIISCLFLLFTLGIFLYNSCILKQHAYIAALRGSLLLVENEFVMSDTKEVAKGLLEENLIGINQSEIEVTVSFHEVTVEINTQMKNVISKLWQELFPNSLKQVNAVGKANRIRQKLFIRTIRKLEAVVEEQLDKEEEIQNKESKESKESKERGKYGNWI